jgi:hypothetical protein
MRNGHKLCDPKWIQQIVSALVQIMCPMLSFLSLNVADRANEFQAMMDHVGSLILWDDL